MERPLPPATVSGCFSLTSFVNSSKLSWNQTSQYMLENKTDIWIKLSKILMTAEKITGNQCAIGESNVFVICNLHVYL